MIPQMMLRAAAGQRGNYFNSVLYVGNDSTNAITGVTFSPALVWLTNRGGQATADGSRLIFDVPRGVNKSWYSDVLNSQAQSSTTLTSFDEDGFTLGSSPLVNDSPDNHVAWCWRADETATHSSHDGERYDKNTGLSIIKYGGDGVAGRTITHSLGSVIKFAMFKNLEIANNNAVYHVSMDATNPEDYYDYIDLDNNPSFDTGGARWNSTAPTSTQFTLGSHETVNQNTRDFVAYLWSEVPGFSKFGYYTGNGSTTGPIITTGFRVGWWMSKSVDGNGATKEHFVWDSARNTSNPRDAVIRVSSKTGELTTPSVDFNATTVQIKSNSTNVNDNGKKYYYCAFAEAA